MSGLVFVLEVYEMVYIFPQKKYIKFVEIILLFRIPLGDVFVNCSPPRGGNNLERADNRGNTFKTFPLYLLKPNNKIMYGLTKAERIEVEQLERVLTFSNGVFDNDKINENPKKAEKLKELYKKKRDLMLATLN